MADRPNPQAPAVLYVAATLIFLAGWVLARGANMQKFTFKRDPGRVFLGLLAPRTISDGAHSILCSGFWGVSRHVNYLGEVLTARERDDDRRCAAKYGPLWAQYRERVPWRIVPHIY